MGALRGLMERVLGAARRRVEVSERELVPAWFIEMGDGNLGMMFTPWSGDAEKDAIAEEVRRVLERDGALAYVLVHEAWVVRRAGDWGTKEEAMAAAAAMGRPSEAPDREEVLHLLGVARGGESLVCVVPIETSGEARVLGEPDWKDGADFEGRFKLSWGRAS